MMAEPAVTCQGVVYPCHCDHMAHRTVMWHIGKFDEATWHPVSGIGLTPSIIRANARGMAAVRQNVACKRELRAGDVVSSTAIQGFKEDRRSDDAL